MSPYLVQVDLGEAFWLEPLKRIFKKDCVFAPMCTVKISALNVSQKYQ